MAGVAAVGMGLAGCDWPQYLAGPRHTGFNRFEHELGRENVGDLEVAWKGQTLSATAPAVVDGVVYLDGNSLDAETGEPLPVGGPGAFTAVSGRSVLGCGFSGGLGAIDRRTGASRWLVPEAQCWGSGLTVAAGVAYTDIGPPPLFGVGAFRVSDGSALWRRHDACPADSTAQWVATVAGGLAYVTCQSQVPAEEQSLVALDAGNGRTRWSRVMDTTTFTSSPAVDGHRLFVSGGGLGIGEDRPPGKVYCLDARTGAPIWTTTIPRFIGLSAPAVAGSRLFVLDTDGVLRALDVRTGTILWTASADVLAPFGSPVVANGVVYTVGFNGVVDAFDTRDGTRLFHTELNRQVFGAGPVVAEGTLFVTTSAVDIFAFRPPDG